MTLDKAELTQLLLDWNAGDGEALEQLIPVVYRELHSLARGYFHREPSGHTLQATALVNEVYLKLVDQDRVRWKNRAHFFGVAAQLMRRILVDSARARKAVKRGGEAQRVPLEEILVEDQEFDLLALNDALERLQALDPQQARVVELRYFAGLTIQETAEAMGISPATVKREWTSARAWLWTELQGS